LAHANSIKEARAQRSARRLGRREACAALILARNAAALARQCLEAFLLRAHAAMSAFWMLLAREVRPLDAHTADHDETAKREYEEHRDARSNVPPPFFRR
jgi:hypothetical protein